MKISLKQRKTYAELFNLFAFTILIISPNFNSASAQFMQMPMNSFHNRKFESFILNNDTLYTGSVQPYPITRLKQTTEYFQKDSINEKRSWFYRKLFNEHFIDIVKNNVKIQVDPLFNFTIGKELIDDSEYSNNTNLYTNTRGVLLNGKIGKNITFRSTFKENQSFFPLPVRNFVTRRKVVPGEGRIKVFEKKGFDYSSATGKVNYKVTENFSIEGGHGKHFIGKGYRSLLLSDNSFNYPYLKFRTKLFNDKLLYTNIFSSLSSVERIPFSSNGKESLFKKKAGSFHFLEYNISKGFYIGFFEGVIWQRWEEKKGTKNFNPLLFNPIIFTNSSIYGLNNTNNSLTGLNIHFSLNNMLTYAQFSLDNIKKDRYAYQSGIKLYDTPFTGMFLQLEYNHSEPYTYSHSKALQNYAHYNQALSHPLQSNFDELIFIMNHEYKGIFAEIKLNYAEYEKSNSNKNGGYNIFLTNNANNVSTIKIKRKFANFKIGYILNPKTNMLIEAGLRYWKKENDAIDNIESAFFYLGFKTHLWRNYYDF